MEHKCYHKELTRDQQMMKKWLSLDSLAYKVLVEIVLDTRLLKDLEQMMLFKHTGMFKLSFRWEVSVKVIYYVQVCESFESLQNTQILD